MVAGAVIPATRKIEAGEFLETSRWSLQWAEIVPLLQPGRQERNSISKKKKKEKHNLYDYSSFKFVKVCFVTQNTVCPCECLVHLKRMCTLLLVVIAFHKYQFKPVTCWCSFCLYSCWFLPVTEKGVFNFSAVRVDMPVYLFSCLS